MPDHKLPRSSSSAETPNLGVPRESSWSADTGVHDVDDAGDAIDADKRMHRRIKETSAAVGALRAETAQHIDRIEGKVETVVEKLTDHDSSIIVLSDKVDKVGTHLSSQDVKIKKIDDKVEKVDGKVDVLGEHVSNIRETLAGVTGKLDILPRLVDTLTKDRDAKRADDHVTLTAKVEVERAGKIATIEDSKDAKKFKRNFILKVVGIVGSLGTLVVTLIETRGC